MYLRGSNPEQEGRFAGLYAKSPQAELGGLNAYVVPGSLLDGIRQVFSHAVFTRKGRHDTVCSSVNTDAIVFWPEKPSKLPGTSDFFTYASDIYD